MHQFVSKSVCLCVAATVACSANRPPAEMPRTEAAAQGTLARVFYWRARPGKMGEYSRYIREVAEPIDGEAQRHGAFLSVTTYVARDTAAAWTHMRVFVLRDSAQLAGLAAALDAASAKIEPDTTKHRTRSEYAATLRDRAGDATLEILR